MTTTEADGAIYEEETMETTQTQETTMLAFTGTEVRRDELLSSLEAHREADRIIQGEYWQGNGVGRGCAVGCSIHDFRPGREREHKLYEDLFGVPESIAHLEDTIFEGLPEDEAKEWPLRFARAIKPGSDLGRVTPAVLYRIVERRRDALEDLEIEDDLRDKVRAAMDEVLDVVEEWRDTGEVDADVARSAEVAARSAAAVAARSTADTAWSAEVAARSAAAVAAWSTADAARSAGVAASSAAWSAADAARSAGSAKKEEYRWIADTLIEEIEAAPVVAA